MNIKKIIQEEINDFEWVDSISAIPTHRFKISFCGYSLGSDDGRLLVEVIGMLEGHFIGIRPSVFDSSNIVTSLREHIVDGDSGFYIYVIPYGDGSIRISWDNCITFDDSYETVFTPHEFLSL